jgi:hypothetical protein
MSGSCCYRHFSNGEPVCPLCNSQQGEYQAELETARQFRVSSADLKTPVREMLKSGALSGEESGMGARFSARTLTVKNPNRRKVFELFGVYLPEREARALLKKIHEFKWIEAEKAGEDIWDATEPDRSFETAARHWADRFLPQYLEKLDDDAA